MTEQGLRCRHRVYKNCDCTGLNAWTERRLRRTVIRHKAQAAWLDTWAALDEIDRLRALLTAAGPHETGPENGETL